MAHQQAEFAVVEDGAGTCMRLAVVGEVDLATSDALRRQLRRLQAESIDVQLDLSRVEFMDCSGVHVLDDALTDASCERGRVEVAPNVAPPVKRLFELLQIELATASSTTA